MSAALAPVEAEPSPPREPLGRLFLRFLRFGLLAWGGPAAQIAMIQQELVVEERWISPEKFRRVLGVYQVLPGPEAHELCVYFGMLARGRFGGLAAGLGFMLPGLAGMLALSWLYLRFGLATPRLQAVFGAVQIAVVAVIVRAVCRIGGHTLREGWLLAIAALAAAAHLAGVHFALVLAAGGALLRLARRSDRLGLASVIVLALAMAAWIGLPAAPVVEAPATPAGIEPTPARLAATGLRAGLLSFGGAYTALPFLRADAVGGGWLSETQFLDGLAIHGVLPAPLVIFGTFVGFVAGGFAGALTMTVAIFLPAFAFTLAGHQRLERLVEAPSLRPILDGVTAAVVGLIAATAGSLLVAVVETLAAALVCGGVLAVLFLWRSKLAVPASIAIAAMLGPTLDALEKPPEPGPIVFVCEHGSAKSVVAAAHFNAIARARALPFRAISRGTSPDADLSPAAVAGLAADGLAAPGSPSALVQADLEQASRLVLFGVDLPIGLEPRSPVATWNVPPVSTDYAAARAAIVASIERQLDELVALQEIDHRRPPGEPQTICRSVRSPIDTCLASFFWRCLKKCLPPISMEGPVFGAQRK